MKIERKSFSTFLGIVSLGVRYTLFHFAAGIGSTLAESLFETYEDRINLRVKFTRSEFVSGIFVLNVRPISMIDKLTWKLSKFHRVVDIVITISIEAMEKKARTKLYRMVQL